jgi:DNA polymerase III subunit gamma/tau
MLTTAAFNALLKTLEEPPPHVKFILCTTDPQKVPITVLSRCQRYDFAPVDVPSIVTRLQHIVSSEGREAEPEALQLLARRAEGSLRDSQSLLEQLLAYCTGTIRAQDVHQMLGTAESGRLAALTGHLIRRDAAQAVAAIDEAACQGVDCGQLAEQLLGFFRDMLAAAVGCPPEMLRYTSSQEYDTLKEAGNQLGLETTLAAFEVLDQAVIRMRQTPQPRTLLEIAIIRICHLENLDQLAALIQRMERGESPSPIAPASPAPRPSSSSRTRPDTERSEPSAAEKKTAEIPSDPPPARGELPKPAQLTAESADQIWKQVLSEMGDMTADFASYYDHLAISAPDSLVVHFREEYTLQKESCDSPQRKAQLEQAMSRKLGRHVRIDLAVMSEGKSQPAQPPVSMRQLMREKESHPLVRQAIQLFDAEVIRIDTQPSPPGVSRATESSSVRPHTP